MLAAGVMCTVSQVHFLRSIDADHTPHNEWVVILYHIDLQRTSGGKPGLPLELGLTPSKL